jgi:hypothetical protein
MAQAWCIRIILEALFMLSLLQSMALVLAICLLCRSRGVRRLADQTLTAPLPERMETQLS